MSVTATHARTIQEVLNAGDANEIADALRKIRFGNMVTPLKRVFTGLSSAASFDLTALDAYGETTGPSNPNRLAALAVNTLRVVTGTATGVRQVCDVGATLSTSIARISDDGKTITFEAVITAFTIEYIPRPYTDPTTVFALES